MGTGAAPPRLAGDCGAACERWPPLGLGGRAGASGAERVGSRAPPLPPAARAGSAPGTPRRGRPAASALPRGGSRGLCASRLVGGPALCASATGPRRPGLRPGARPLPSSGCCPRPRREGNGCGSGSLPPCWGCVGSGVAGCDQAALAASARRRPRRRCGEGNARGSGAAGLRASALGGAAAGGGSSPRPVSCQRCRERGVKRCCMKIPCKQGEGPCV